MAHACPRPASAAMEKRTQLSPIPLIRKQYSSRRDLWHRDCLVLGQKFANCAKTRRGCSLPLPVSTNDRQKKSLAAILGEGNDCAAREACRPNLWGEIGESKYATDRRGYWGIGGCQSVAILYDHTVFPKVPAGFTFYIFYDRISYKPQASSCNTIKAAANRPPLLRDSRIQTRR